MTKEQINAKILEIESAKEEMKSLTDLEEKEDLEDIEAKMEYGVQKKKTRNPKSNLGFFEHELLKHPKGYFQVYQATMDVAGKLKVPLYLHAVRDSKVVYRISSKYAAKPTAELTVTAKDPSTGQREKLQIQSSKAHAVFRKKLGYNDQSDAKRSRLGLSSRYYRRWPQKPFAKN